MDINYWFAFAGQGIQRPGMLKKEYENKKETRDYIKQANSILKYNLSEIMFEADKETISKTLYTQPITFLYTLNLANQVSQKVNLMGSLGHSLGAITAATYNNFISFENGLQIIKKRATLMEDICTNLNSTGPHMIAISFNEELINLAIKEKYNYSSKPNLEKTINNLVTILKKHKKGEIEISAYNSPYKYVLSGDSEILKFPVEIFKNIKEIKKIKKEEDNKENDNEKLSVTQKGKKLIGKILEHIGHKLSEETKEMMTNDYELFQELKTIILNDENYISRITPLNVGGPFHSQFMFKASKEFRNFLLPIKFQKPTNNLLYISDFNGEIIRDEKLLKEYLVSALFNPVRWDLAIEKARRINPYFISDNSYSKIIKDYDCIKCLNQRDLKL